MNVRRRSRNFLANPPEARIAALSPLVQTCRSARMTDHGGKICRADVEHAEVAAGTYRR
jgi:hypothetical protein